MKTGNRKVKQNVVEVGINHNSTLLVEKGLLQHVSAYVQEAIVSLARY
jgi:hypothetical protein